MDQDMFELDEEAGLEFAPEGEPQVVADDHYEWATATLLDEFDLNAFSMEQFSEAIDHLVDSGEVSPEEAEEVMDRLRELAKEECSAATGHSSPSDRPHFEIEPRWRSGELHNLPQ
ncbi:hypothetical protein PtA15_10A477 [Puccinia triticina]|uniref:Uncharacterized protein n=1 Tax=Puccinia triticina TaxID=208348 RepID=A0ABY7CUR9_9BASI|nr:uncharacterized protein PtA15_10A477 [Puccinia triticina]WAQ89054.1 hypothetical protein PtA15_10A477 [Puccinia triticina]WAR59113.1 hypothetical protein PtB15_10B455 [Puccinia triticina]